MPLSLHAAPLAQVKADWLIVGIFEEEPLGDTLAALDVPLGGTLGRMKQAGDILGKPLELTAVLGCQGIDAARVLLVGLGPRGKLDRQGLGACAAAAMRDISTKAYGAVACALPADVPNLDSAAVARAVGAGLLHGCQGPGLRKSKPDRFAPIDILLVAPADSPELREAVARANAEGEAVALVRELVNLPPCDLYPETFAERAREVAGKTVGLEITVLDEKQIAAERMGSLLGVAQGSIRPPRLVVLRYRAGKGKRTLGFVGKGVTFDSGGLSLKTTEQMLDMKCDMAGAATVLGAMQAIATLKIPVNVVGVLALVENMPSDRAFKMGDVLKARNGKTIEIHNTDAEGRLILADALSYAVDQKVDHLVDLATLTGACVVALGTDVVGVMSNNDAWSQQLQQAAARAGELVWPLPMFGHFSELIKSTVADMKNTGGSRYGGAITAAKLLEEFVAGVPWVHLDIAGPAFADNPNPVRDAGGTGAMTRTLVELATGYDVP